MKFPFKMSIKCYVIGKSAEYSNLTLSKDFANDITVTTLMSQTNSRDNKLHFCAKMMAYQVSE